MENRANNDNSYHKIKRHVNVCAPQSLPYRLPTATLRRATTRLPHQENPALFAVDQAACCASSHPVADRRHALDLPCGHRPYSPREDIERRLLTA
jgi:hypothetical protein